MKTYSQKNAEVKRAWYLIDASSAPLGRVATRIAALLIGKDKPTFTPHVDGGDHVVVINAANPVVTGGKIDKKVYYRHSGFPGGIYSRTLGEQLEKDPVKLIHDTVRGMLPNNKLRDQRLRRLKIYAGAEHNHQAQQPQELSIRGKK